MFARTLILKLACFTTVAAAATAEAGPLRFACGNLTTVSMVVELHAVSARGAASAIYTSDSGKMAMSAKTIVTTELSGQALEAYELVSQPAPELRLLIEVSKTVGKPLKGSLFDARSGRRKTLHCYLYSN